MTDRDASGKFTKGNTGNPGGRPKSDLSITALIDAVVTVDDWKFIIEAQVKRARRGDNKAIEWLTDRRFGKAIQATQLTGADGGPVQITRVEVILPPEDKPDDSAG